MAIKFTYPDDIGNPEYGNRKITIKIRKPAISGDASYVLDEAREVVTTAANFVKYLFETTEQGKNNLFSRRYGKDPLEATIVLPLPNSFDDNQTHGWSEDTGIIGTVGKGLLDASAATTISKIPRIGDKVGGFISNIPGASSISIDKVLGSAAALSGTRKFLVDPGYFQNYSGSAPRTFNMQWDFIPNSAREATTIMLIIMKLKQYSSPNKSADGISLLAPYYLDVELNNSFMTSMINLKRVVISNISVNYSADGHMQQTIDGMPKHMTLNLTLNEVDMTTSQDYDTKPRLPNGVK